METHSQSFMQHILSYIDFIDKWKLKLHIVRFHFQLTEQIEKVQRIVYFIDGLCKFTELVIVTSFYLPVNFSKLRKLWRKLLVCYIP